MSDDVRLSGLGRLELLARHWDQARSLHEQARRIAAEQGYKYGEIHSEMGLALGARRSGDLDAAEAHLLHIRDDFADMSSEVGDHLLLAELGFIAELRGDADQCVRHHLRGLDVARSLGEPRALALSLEGPAGAAALRGCARAAGCAALLLGAADVLGAEEERPQIDAELPTPYVDRTELLESLLAAAAETGELREGVSPQAAARVLVSAFFGTQHISDVLRGRTDAVDRWAESSALLFHAIRA